MVKKWMVVLLVRVWDTNRCDSLQERFGQYLNLPNNFFYRYQIIVTDRKDVLFLFVLKNKQTKETAGVPY